METSIRDFFEELKAIPNENKDAYLKALSNCPQLLYLESPAQRFLATINDIPIERIAQSFAEYWDNRKKTFGEENAFRPLHLSNGALTTASAALLRSSWVWPLKEDREGRPGCFLNMSTQDPQQALQTSTQDRLRSLFYVLQVLSENDASRSKGCVLLILLDKSFEEALDVLLWLDRTLSVLPIRLAEVHTIPVGETVKDFSFFVRHVRTTLKMLLSSNPKRERHILERCHHIHRGKTKETLVAALESSGMNAQHIPSLLGGGWTQREQASWIEDRIAKEAQRESDFEDFTPEYIFPDESTTTRDAFSSEERRKLRDRIKSRQVKNRRQCKLRSLELECKYLEEQKEATLASNKRLKTALDEAKRLVAASQQGIMRKSWSAKHIRAPNWGNPLSIISTNDDVTVVPSSTDHAALGHQSEDETTQPASPIEIVDISSPRTEPHVPLRVEQQFQAIQPAVLAGVPAQGHIHLGQEGHVGTPLYAAPQFLQVLDLNQALVQCPPLPPTLPPVQQQQQGPNSFLIYSNLGPFESSMYLAPAPVLAPAPFVAGMSPSTSLTSTTTLTTTFSVPAWNNGMPMNPAHASLLGTTAMHQAAYPTMIQQPPANPSLPLVTVVHPGGHAAPPPAPQHQVFALQRVSPAVAHLPGSIFTYYSPSS